ncbi:hypothetical protein GCM10023065_20040 [Microbacterium laevaniformans]|nr:hypothetical protein GCM10017578_14040 [Microbacterium laevaniformans]
MRRAMSPLWIAAGSAEWLIATSSVALRSRYWTYLRRELSDRKKQTTIVAIGLAVAVALVIMVNALSAGVRDAAPVRHR